MHDDSSALAGKLQPWLARLRKVQPLVHCITNYVTVNDVANLLLACGASPVMADAEEEASDGEQRSRDEEVVEDERRHGEGHARHEEAGDEEPTPRPAPRQPRQERARGE